MDVGHERNRQDNSSSPDSNNELFPSMSPDKLEFYKTYDVMTGIRIAATLGGFFSLMVLLVVYKSKCKSRSVSEEDLAAVAAAVVEEEERKETERRLSLYGGGRGQSATRGRASLAAAPPFSYRPPLSVGVYTRHHSLTPSPPMAIYNQVIQPTPQVSPCSSLATLCGGRGIGESVIVGDPTWRSPILPLTHLTPPVQPRLLGMAPLAAHDPRSESLHLSTFPHYSSPDWQSSPQPTDQERSLGSDSVFLDEELVDTEDEVDGFSTDSESGSSPAVSTGSSQTAGRKIPSRLAGGNLRPTNPLPSPQLSTQQDIQLKHRVSTPPLQYQQRRYSSPTGLQACTEMAKSSSGRASSTSLAPDVIVTGSTLDKSKKTSSDSDTLLATPALRNLPTSPIEARSFMSISCDRLVESLQRSQIDLSKDTTQHCAWSQETLF